MPNFLRGFRLNQLKGKKHTHSAAGTAEEVEGSPAFSSGATLAITPLLTAAYVGHTKAEAEENKLCAPAEERTIVTLPNGQDSVWIDAANSAIVVVTEIADLSD